MHLTYISQTAVTTRPKPGKLVDRLLLCARFHAISIENSKIEFGVVSNPKWNHYETFTSFIIYYSFKQVHAIYREKERILSHLK